MSRLPPAKQKRPSGVPFVEVWDDGCRWDVNDSGAGPYLFCNAARVAGVAYCAGHAARAFNLGWKEPRRRMASP